MTIRCIRKDRDEMVQAIVEASPDAVVVVAVLDEEGGALAVDDDASDSALAFVGQVIVETAMRRAFGRAEK